MAQGVSKCNIKFKMHRWGGRSTKLNCGGRSPQNSSGPTPSALLKME